MTSTARKNETHDWAVLLPLALPPDLPPVILINLRAESEGERWRFGVGVVLVMDASVRGVCNVWMVESERQRL